MKALLVLPLATTLISVPMAGAAQIIAWGQVSHLTSTSIRVGSTACTLGIGSPRPHGLDDAPARTKFIAVCDRGTLVTLIPSPRSVQNPVVMNRVRTVFRSVVGTRLASGCNFRMPSVLKPTGLPLLGVKLVSYDLTTCTGIAQIGARSAIGQGPRASITVH